MSSLRNIFISTISGKPSDIFSDIDVAASLGVKGIHFDVMDGVFVPRLGLYPELLAAIRELTDLYIEVHMMIQKPSIFLSDFISAGANRVVLHLETTDNLSHLIDTAKSSGVDTAIALNPESPVSSVANYLPNINSVMLMGIQPGIPRHPFIESTFSKIDEVKKLLDVTAHTEVEISIDGGITFDNINKIINHGVTSLVCGSGTVYHSSRSLEENLKKLEVVLGQN